MRNLVKEYIESGKSFEDLKNEFAININEFGDLLCLNYDQIESPKTAAIVRQCRGIILDKNTLEIVHYPFYRFYNLEEVFEEHQKFDFQEMKNVYALSKEDGSLFGCFNHKGKWYISTRSQIGGNNKVSIGLISFGDIFDEAIGMSRDEFFSWLNADLDYTFELCSPANTIVTPYEKSEIYLIGLRRKSNDFKEENIMSYPIHEAISCIKLPKMFKVIDDNGNFVGLENLKAMANNLDKPTDEGFVLVDYSNYDHEFGYYPRIKVKNSSYVALHHLRGSLENESMNYGGILEIIWKGEQDEVTSVMPHFKPYFNEVEEKYKKFIEAKDKAYNDVSEMWNIPIEQRKDPQIKKNFAMSIDKRFSSFFFNMFNNNMSFKESVEHAAFKSKNYFKKLWEDYVSKY